ncbi:tRNA (adenosine(37)-N6)-dimethylallyltransferase MiaA [Aurantiacibacter rhizosphaerae]|uniref:tRNA dimethylallyltransferase n=1 Tax=Aurantiacibacter rhizosphaerae TaxID=2691582 RepID=A0A844XED1_9SPHN|nr:tRNA (adenosine(37)-N6)-dimethylallyltransferase MiaA [Aurantiacibacter rhizosphaerae]MWV28119.1 tRNA (adenosine(37)-N6)-dimethylallyltransferase MiaA [Aurantiacibacter rhizosphaerae]
MSKSESPVLKQVALIAGPTASGKSDLAVTLALALEKSGRRAVVINADSAQVYADLQILSARPSSEEMRGVPHRLFGAWDGAQACSAADWAAAAKREIEEAHAAGAVPILVGGTGLYIRTLLDGIAPVPPIDPAIREEVRAMDAEDLYAAVQREDAEAAQTLNANDTQRLSRALEVVRSSGKPLREWQRQKTGGIGDAIALAPLVLLPDREWLYKRCDRRFALMMENGAVEEVERLLTRDLSEDLPVMRAIGVPQIAEYLRGSLSQEEAIARGQQVTRNYAKRQYTWLRHQPPEDWPRLAPDNVQLRTVFETIFS